MKKGTYLFFGAFLLGVFLANFWGISSGKDVGTMGEYYMNRYLYTEVTGRELFVYLFFERVPKAGILLLLSMGLGIWIIYAYITYLGVSVGVLSVIAIMNYGMEGILLMFGFLCPQWICYIPILLLWHMMLKREKDKPNIKGITFLIIMGILLLSGIFLESYVNPQILQGMIRSM